MCLQRSSSVLRGLATEVMIFGVGEVTITSGGPSAIATVIFRKCSAEIELQLMQGSSVLTESPLQAMLCEVDEVSAELEGPSTAAITMFWKGSSKAEIGSKSSTNRLPLAVSIHGKVRIFKVQGV